MVKQIIEDYRIISTKQLVGAIKEGINSSERFCFILGSGASVSSGIPMGSELERKWMAEMEEYTGLAEIHETAEKLKEKNRLEYDFREIEEAWQDTKNLGIPLFKKLIEREKNSNAMGVKRESNQSANEFRKEIEKITDRSDKLENERRQSTEAYYNRGETYGELSEHEKAISDYNIAIELNPEYKEAYSGRAEIYRLMGEIEKATADEEIAVKL